MLLGFVMRFPFLVIKVSAVVPQSVGFAFVALDHAPPRLSRAGHLLGGEFFSLFSRMTVCVLGPLGSGSVCLLFLEGRCQFRDRSQ